MEGAGIAEERGNKGVRRGIGGGRAQEPEEAGVVHLVRRESLQEIAGEGQVVLFLACEAELRAQDARMGSLEDRGEAIELLRREARRLFVVLVRPV